MASSNQPCPDVAECRASTVALESLIPIAVVIAAGCEPCAESLVERALRLGTPADLIERALAIVAYVRSRPCLERAVGAEVVEHMQKPLQAGQRTLRHSLRAADGPQEPRSNRGRKAAGPTRVLGCGAPTA